MWVDCEMTGLDLRTDALIEIAALVTDSDLNVLGDGVDVVIHADDEALAGMPEVVRAMHERVRADRAGAGSTVTIGEAEEMVLDYVREFVPDPRTAPLCGNSIATDRGLPGPGHARARRAPALPDDRRLRDQGAVPALVPAGLLRPAGQGDGPPGAGRHQGSIRELAYYRRTVFVPGAGPSSEQAQAVAAELAAKS